MILPTTFVTALTVALLGMLCAGIWPSFFKSAKGWRFELFYFDFALGTVLAAIVLAVTFGSMGEELTVSDNLLITGKRQMGAAVAGGIALNLGNFLTLSGVAISGMSVALPISIGLAFVIGTVSRQMLKTGEPLALSLAGAALVLVALIAAAMAYFAGGGVRSAKQGTTYKGVFVSALGGLLVGLSYFPLAWSRVGEIGLGPYTAMALVAAAVLGSTIVLNLYFINLPIQGKPIPLSAYFKGSFKNHMLGALGGIIWAVGLLALLVSSGAPPEVGLPTSAAFALSHAATLVGALVGFLFWKEYSGAPGRARALFSLAMLLTAVGIAIFAASPLLAG
ncbi:MAG TPA: hypothetical protein VEQ63_04205 [Bryobacteraceae bacterium]|nr:hypothetical protein [Bryobacteraceae bacterium]